MNIRIPNMVTVFPAAPDARAWVESGSGFLTLKVTAEETALSYVRLRWNFTAEEKRADAVRVLGDSWERGYGDMEWRGIVPERCMPWVCMVSNGSDADPDTKDRRTECFGVKTRASALCFWQYDTEGVTLWADIRNGGSGVLLGGRVLSACDIVFGEFCGTTAFRAIREFYYRLNDTVLTTDHKVYGSNNWYYAYGNSSNDEILEDTKIVADLCAGLPNRPYMVIDDGWEPNSFDGPWIGGPKFPDMKKLADDIKARGVRPGIWVRYLADMNGDRDDTKPDYYLNGRKGILDPSHPGVLELVKEDTGRIVRDWGYQLIKHDYSTYDIFGDWGFMRKDTLTSDGWHFYDRTRTSAEIVVDFYRTIYEAAEGKALILGCNVIGHLAAGLVHLNRVGDDTSGIEWERTRKYGVNTLAFRLMHDKAFFAADADCVGIAGKYPFRPFNEAWLKLLAESGTPLFVSCKPGVLNEEELNILREGFARASLQADTMEPVDWMENTCPERWLVNGKEETFRWIPEEGSGFRPA